MAEADALAAAVAVGIVPAQMALSFFILTLWAFGEAVLDVKMLLAGGKIPFWKTEGTWKTCLSGLLDQSFLKETGESSGDGRTYTEYLSCLILLMDRKIKKFPDDGSDPVEYPDETGGFLSGELRIPD